LVKPLIPLNVPCNAGYSRNSNGDCVDVRNKCPSGTGECERGDINGVSVCLRYRDQDGTYYKCSGNKIYID
jgi:hypothetical protein